MLEMKSGVDILAEVGGVKTSGADFQAGTVVIAGGAWSGQIMGLLGREIPIKPVRGQMLMFRTHPGLIEHIVLIKDRYFIPRRDGRILVGSTLEEAGFDKSTTDRARAELTEFALTYLPGLADYPLEKHWSGLRPASPESVPMISAVPEFEGLYINAGHFRNGVVLGLASARLLVDIMLSRPPVISPEPYQA